MSNIQKLIDCVLAIGKAMPGKEGAEIAFYEAWWAEGRKRYDEFRADEAIRAAARAREAAEKAAGETALKAEGQG